jgi:hypothetical protein
MLKPSVDFGLKQNPKGGRAYARPPFSVLRREISAFSSENRGKFQKSY